MNRRLIKIKSWRAVRVNQCKTAIKDGQFVLKLSDGRLKILAAFCESGNQFDGFRPMVNISIQADRCRLNCMQITLCDQRSHCLMMQSQAAKGNDEH
ncbi:MAG TPA: hypothetical protein PLL88_05160 [Anaerolineaceae bacterium]|nr:hypothetical protein [Anaerolineaceae bacterium]